MANWPSWMDGLMNTHPGSIDRRFPKYWNDGEGGIDFDVKPGTPVTALADGVIVGAGYFCNSTHVYGAATDQCGHGVITTRVTNSDGSQTDLYYQHVMIAPGIKVCTKGLKSCGGQVVKKGQVIATISNFGMIELGINVGNGPNPQPYPHGWGGIWGADPSPGPHVDPEPYLRAIATGQNVTRSLGAGTTGSSGNGSNLFSEVAKNTVSKLHVGPTDSVPMVLAVLDDLFILVNPFIVDPPPPPITLSGPGVSAAIPDPIGYIEGVSINMFNDSTTLAMRALLFILGAVILIKIFLTFIDVGAIVNAVLGVAKTAALT